MNNIDIDLFIERLSEDFDCVECFIAGYDYILRISRFGANGLCQQATHVIPDEFDVELIEQEAEYIKELFNGERDRKAS